MTRARAARGSPWWRIAALGEKPWPYPQMGAWDPMPLVALLLQASTEFKAPGYRDAARRAAGPAAASDWRTLLYP